MKHCGIVGIPVNRHVFVQSDAAFVDPRDPFCLLAAERGDGAEPRISEPRCLQGELSRLLGKPQVQQRQRGRIS